MKYHEISTGKLIEKLNRFLAVVEVDGNIEQVHIKNTGRLKELLIPNVEVALEQANNPNRITKYSIISVKKEGQWVNIDSLAPNKVAFEALQQGLIQEIGEVKTIKREATYGASRFDLYYEKDNIQGFIEVKGVTLEQNGVAMFPDAPTTRGPNICLN